MEYKGVEIYQTPGEQKILREQIQLAEDIKGPIIEIGVYEGATAAIIREESQKELYLFDTFEGLPDKLHKSDSKGYFVGHCAAGEEHVKRLMKDEKGVHIIKGVFPESGESVKDKKFSFAHLDVDIYQSTKESLEFLLPRMKKGGRILVHDYPAHAGVKQAVEELGLEIETLGVEGRQGLIKI